MQASIDHPLDTNAPLHALLLEDERWKLVTRIAATPAFTRSPRLAHLLAFLCEQAILKHTDLLTEQNIAHKVFERRGDFNPAADTIVRSHVLRLRQRLEAYFHEEGRAERLRISIPKGGYVPVFEEVHVAPTPVDVELSIAQPDAPETTEKPEPQSAIELIQLKKIIRRLVITCGILSTVILIAAVLFLTSRLTGRLTNIADETPRHQLWRSLFGKKEKTIIVAADSGLVMLHGATMQNTNLSEYLSRDFSKELGDIPDSRRQEILTFAGRRYTSFVDLELIDRLTHLPEAINGNYSIRFARDINVNDLKTANIILSGSQDANPWLELFEQQMNFVLSDDLSHGIRGFSNRNPKPGENSYYKAERYEYGVLALLPNLNGNGNVLAVEGTSVAGTQAISDFLFTDSDLDAFLKKIRKADGTFPRFEILLESRSLGGSASQSQIVAYRTY